MAGEFRRIAVVAVGLSVALAMGFTSTASSPALGHELAAETQAPPSLPINVTTVDFNAFRAGGLPLVPGASFHLQTATAATTGPLHFAELIDGLPVDLGTPQWSVIGTLDGLAVEAADVVVSGATAGSHTYQAIYEPTDTLTGLTLTKVLDIEPVAMSLEITTPTNPAQTHHPIALTANLTGPDTGTAPTGTIEWQDADTSAVLGSSALADPTLALGALPIGVRHFVAAYSGDAEHAAATSPVFTLTVTADIVDASGVGVQYTTFYPVKDHYRDTVAITGTRAEAISVAIRIYSPAGKKVRSASVASAVGPYSWAWNGKSSSGALLPNGKYKVVQTLTDAAGVTKAYTSHVTISHKRLVSHTVTVTKLGSAVGARGAWGSGSVTVSKAGGYTKLKAGNAGAAAGWELKIPAAKTYKSVSFQVYAKAPFSAPATYISIQNFATCVRASGDWDEGCFDHWTSIGNSSGHLAWYSVSSSSAANRSGRYVRGAIDVASGTAYVYKVRVKVVYTVLQ